MKKIFALILALVLCLGTVSPALALTYGEEYAGYTTTGSQQYRDVSTAHWAYSSIETCSQRTWFNGYPDGTFRPDGLITREEAAKVFAVALGLPLEEDPQVTYTDTANCWAKAYIEATKVLFPNVANLQGTASFRPTQTITREETVYALVVAWGYGSQSKNADLSILNMFSDTNSISVGVKPYMAVAVSEGLVSGLPDGTIAAQKGLTRAEFATLLARALSHGYGDTRQEFLAPKIRLEPYKTVTAEETLTVAGSVAPANVSLTLNDSDVRVFSDGSFSLSLPLQVGNNSFILTAENAYGIKDTQTITVERTDKLAISIDPFEAKTVADEITLTGQVTPANGIILSVDGAEIPTTSSGGFHATLPLVVGVNRFDFSAENASGGSAAKSVKVIRELALAQEPEIPSGSIVTDRSDASAPKDKEHIVLVLDAAQVGGPSYIGVPSTQIEAALLFTDTTVEIVHISKLDGIYLTGYDSAAQVFTALSDTKIGAEYPAFYHYEKLENDRYELTRVVADTTGAEDGWMDTEIFTDTTVWPTNDFAKNAIYTADDETLFIVHTDDEASHYGIFQTYHFSNLPVLSHVSGLAVGTRDNPGVAKYVYLHYVP